jgi:hypothetical protein
VLKIISFNLAVLLLAFLGLEGVVRMFIPVRNVGPAFSEYDPVYGKRLKASFSTVRVTPEFRMTFTTNSQRHRGPEPQGATTGGLLILGDSYTEGYGVSDGEEYAALIRKEFDRRQGATPTPVINAGITNTGNGRPLKLLLREGKALAPKMIVLQVMNNDFGDNRLEGLFTLNQGGELKEMPGPALGQPSPWSVHQIVESVPGLAHSYAIAAIREMRYAGESQLYGSSSAATDELTYRLWDRIFLKCAEENWPLIVLAVDLRKDRLERLVEIAHTRQVPLVVPPSRVERPDLYYKIDGHWIQQGHQLVAQMLLKAIDETGAFGVHQP